MSAFDPITIAWCAFVLFAGGAVKGVSGIGMPVVCVSLLSLLMPLPQVLALCIVSFVVMNIWQAWQAGFGWPMLRRFGPLTAVMVAGTFVTASLLPAMDPRLLYGVVGAAVLLFVFAEPIHRHVRIPARMERWLDAPVGLLAGFLGGVSAIYGPVLIMYLLALRLPKEEFVATTGAILTLNMAALLVALVGNGVLDAEAAAWSTAALLPVALGMRLGQVVRACIDQERFRRLLMIIFALVGLNLVRRAIF